jgi:hypothetical protein
MHRDRRHLHPCWELTWRTWDLSCGMLLTTVCCTALVAAGHACVLTPCQYQVSPAPSRTATSQMKVQHRAKQGLSVLLLCCSPSVHLHDISSSPKHHNDAPTWMESRTAYPAECPWRPNTHKPKQQAHLLTATLPLHCAKLPAAQVRGCTQGTASLANTTLLKGHI